MANPPSGIFAKIKTAGGKTADLAGKAALYSQMYRDPNAKMSMGQRVGGALSDMALSATLGQMGSLGQAMNAGMLARGRGNTKSPTGGSGVPGTTVQATPIKTTNVVQAINQSTQQMLRGLNVLNSTFRSGLNNTTNQIQSQASIMGAVKRDTEDMSISLREIYEVLNKMGYQDKSKHNLFGGGMPRGDNVTNAQAGDSLIGSLLKGLLMQKLLEKALPNLDLPDGDKDRKNTKRGKGGGLGRILKKIPFGKAAGGMGGILGGLALDYGADYATESGYNKTGAGLGILSNIITGASSGAMAGGAAGLLTGGLASLPLGLIGGIAGGLGGLGYGLYDKGSTLFGGGEVDGSKVPTLKGSGRAQSSQSFNTSELTKAEIDEIFRLAPMNAPDNVLFEIAKQKFPGRKYNTLKQRIELLRSLMQPQSSLSSGVKVASADMSSGSYLANRQMLLDNSRSGTSEQALRQQEQQLEKDAFEGVIPQLLNYESREMMYKADKIVFDAGKIEFIEGMGMGGEGGLGGMAPAVPGAGADNFNRPGGTEARDGTGATRVPELSAETKAAAEQLQKSNTFKVAPGTSDPLGQYSDEQLRSQGIVSHNNTDGTKVYSYAPGGIGGHADKIGGSGATEAITPPGAGAKQGTGDLEGTQALQKQIYDSFIQAGFSDNQARALTAEVGRENSYRPDLVFGSHTDPHNQARNSGFFSWQGSRSTELLNRLREKGLVTPDGKLVQSQETLNEMAKFSRHEMENNPAYARTNEEFLQNPDIDPEQASRVLGKDYIRWRIDDPRYAKHKEYRRQHLENITNITQQEQFKNTDAVAQGPTAQAPNLAAGLQGMTPANATNQTAALGTEGTAKGGRFDEKYYEDILKQYDIHADRKGSTENLSPEMKARLGAMYRDAPEHVKKELKIQSAYRDPAHQAKLYAASGGSGMVAKNSQHSKGMAVDLGSGKGGSAQASWNSLSDETKQWIMQNGSKYGIYRPMQPGLTSRVHEDWHFEPIGNRGDWKSQPNQPKADMAAWQDPLAVQQAQKLEAEKQKAQQAAAAPPAQPPAPATPIAANPSMVDPTSAQSAQKVSELSKKTTMNREASTKQGPVTQNIVNNTNAKTDTTGTGFPDKNAPMMAMTDTMEKFTSHLFGMA